MEEEKTLNQRVADLEDEIKLLKEVIKALCRGKQDITGIVIGYDGEKGIRNEFQHEMLFLDFDYKD